MASENTILQIKIAAVSMVIGIPLLILIAALPSAPAGAPRAATSTLSEEGKQSADVEPATETADSGAEATEAGADARITTAFFACSSLADLDRIKVLAFSRNDAKAAVAYGHSHGCEIREPGQTWQIEDRSVWHAAVCIRQQGDPECLWFPDAMIKTAKPRNRS